MCPTILDGDLVLIDMGETRMMRQDDIWAVGYADLGESKRLRLAGEGRIKVMADNARVSGELFRMDKWRIIGGCVRQSAEDVVCSSKAYFYRWLSVRRFEQTVYKEGLV